MTISISHAATPCSEHPATLAAMHDCYRPVLIFAASAADTDLSRQLQEFRDHSAHLHERDVRVVVLTADHSETTPFLQGIPDAHFAEAEQEKLRAQFHIHPERFTVLLIGKDGGEKMRSDRPVSAQDLDRKIDSMPMRQQEMKQPG